MNDLFNGAVEMLNNVTEVLKSWALNWQRLFLSETPEEVPIKQLDNDGNVVDNTTVKNLAKIKAEFEEWKDTVRPSLVSLNNRLNSWTDQIGLKLKPGGKINSGFDYYGMEGVGYDLVRTSQHPAGYLLAPDISVATGSQFRAEVELVADGFLTKGILTLRRELNDFLYSDFVLTGSYVLHPASVGNPISPFIGHGVAVKDGFGDDGKSVRLVWVLTGDDSDEVPPADIPEITNFYGRLKTLDPSKLFDIEEFI